MSPVQNPRGRGAQHPAQSEARALGDPTRYRIFRYIADAHRPVGVAELTDLLRLNENAVRQHLAVLTDAALVGEEHERRNRPGRPRLLYRVNPAICGSWGTEGPYELLATLLSEVVRTETSPREVGHRVGRRRARQIRKAETPSQRWRRTSPLAAFSLDPSRTHAAVTSCSIAAHSSRWP